MKEFVLSFPKDLPIVAMGDFNARPGTPEIKFLTADGLLKEVVIRARNIDHILQRNFSVVPNSTEYKHKKVKGIALSDHPMLTAKLAIDKRTSQHSSSR
ncbi:MAG: hypothetical protein KAI66_04550 [Lentisphaeria bacterium]|nr:hypothetical protein [Lentisphaeria bacterium]